MESNVFYHFGVVMGKRIAKMEVMKLSATLHVKPINFNVKLVKFASRTFGSVMEIQIAMIILMKRVVITLN